MKRAYGHTTRREGRGDGCAGQRAAFPAHARLDAPRTRPHEFYVIDLETTGLDAEGCEVTEVACVHVRANRVHRRFSTLVRIEGRVPADVTALTGIDDEALADAPGFDEAMRGLGEFLGDAALPLFAHNAAFDARVIWAHGIADYIEADCPVCCSMLLARRALPDEPSHSLDALASSLPLVRGRAHRALDDCLCAAQLVDVCYTEIERAAGMPAAEGRQLSLSLGLPSCPKCGSNLVVKDGFTQSGVQVYRCKSCGRRHTANSKGMEVERRGRKAETFSEARARRGDGELSCRHCGSTEINFKEHRGASHRYLCKACGRTTTFRDDDETRGGSAPCPHCGSERTQRKGVRNGRQRYLCDACSKSFSGEILAETNGSYAAQPPMPKADRPPCPSCGSEDTMSHDRTRSGRQRWRCKNCGKRWTEGLRRDRGA